MIALIAAVAENGVLGNDGKLPWHLPMDFAWFKSKTLNRPMIMGRKTYESIGKPLPKRLNIVISRYPQVDQENLIWVSSLEKAIDVARNAFMYDTSEIMVIGGGEIYNQSLPIADRLYITEVKASPKGDAYFPTFDKTQWHKKTLSTHHAEGDQPAFDILQYDKA